MIGESDNRGRPPEVSDEEILNVIRRSDNKEVLTGDIHDAETISIGKEGLRNRLNKLESQGRLSSRTVGQQRLWQLGELESDEPVREPAIGKAHRWANGIRDLGETFKFIAIGFAFSAVIFFIMFLHAEAGQLNPPLLSKRDLLLTGYGAGYVGAGMGVIAGVTYGVSYILPKATTWWVARNNPPSDAGD